MHYYHLYSSLNNHNEDIIPPLAMEGLLVPKADRQKSEEILLIPKLSFLKHKEKGILKRKIFKVYHAPPTKTTPTVAKSLGIDTMQNTPTPNPNPQFIAKRRRNESCKQQ